MGQARLTYRKVIYVLAFFLFLAAVKNIKIYSAQDYLFLWPAFIVSILIDSTKLALKDNYLWLMDPLTGFLYLAYDGYVAVIFKFSAQILVLVIRVLKEKHLLTANFWQLNLATAVIATYGAVNTTNTLKNFYILPLSIQILLQSWIFVFVYLLISILIYSLDKTLEKGKISIIDWQTQKILLLYMLVSILHLTITILLSKNGEILGTFLALGLFYLIQQFLYLSLKNNSNIEKMLYRATIDPLTELYNRWVFEEEVQSLIKGKSKFSLLLFDLDDFKRVNDKFGHLAGDKVLKKVGKIIKESIRHTDIPCRYGGEEFVIIFKELSKKDAYIISERIREKIEQQLFRFNEQHFTVTISGGIASYPEDGNILDEVIKKADEILYKECKKSGKNKVIAFEKSN